MDPMSTPEVLSNRAMKEACWNYPAGPKRGRNTRVVCMGRDRRRKICAALAGLAVCAAGCGSTGRSVADRPRATDPIGTSQVTAQLPADVSVGPVAATTDAAWALASTKGEGSAIYSVSMDGTASVVVQPDVLADLQPTSIGIAAWNSGFVLTGERCDDDPVAAECARDSGIVELRDRKGKLVKRLTLWQDQATQAGGTSPQFLGLDGKNTWVQGLDDTVEVDPSGAILSRVGRPEAAQLCVSGGTLYAIASSGGAAQVLADGATNPDGTPRPFTADEFTSAAPATLSMRRWTGSDWAPVGNGTTNAAGTSPEVHCNGNVVTAWNMNEPVATWTAEDGWTTLPKPSEPLTQGSDLQANLSPVTGTSGGIYRLDDRFGLRRFDPATGKLVDTGMRLEPTTPNTKAFITLTVAESAHSLFACAERFMGAPGGPTTPGAVCGLLPEPG